MNIQSFSEPLAYNENRIVTQAVLETPFSREIRILLKNGQTMKEHKAPRPIIVHFLDGRIYFGVEGEILALKNDDTVTLYSNVLRDLTANEDSIIRLSFSKLDDAERA
ncbi:MAG: cupin [Salibacteraceae bacterium]